MAIVWTGPFAGLAGGGFSGWSNHVTGAAALHTRYRDGDPASSFVWREMAGNCNHYLASHRRIVWMDAFHGPASADPSKSYTGTSWAADDAIYAIGGPFILTPNAIRGQNVPPRLSIKVRARRTGGAASHYVRVYAVGTLADCVTNWDRTSALGSDGDGYRQFTISSGTYPATSWSAAATLTVPHDPLGQFCVRSVWNHPASTALSGVGIDASDEEITSCFLVLAAIGDGAGNGTYVAAIQAYEEAPGA